MMSWLSARSGRRHDPHFYQAMAALEGMSEVHLPDQPGLRKASRWLKRNNQVPPQGMQPPVNSSDPVCYFTMLVSTSTWHRSRLGHQSILTPPVVRSLTRWQRAGSLQCGSPAQLAKCLHDPTGLGGHIHR